MSGFILTSQVTQWGFMIAYLRTNNDLSEKPPHTLCKNLYLTLHAMIYDPLSRWTRWGYVGMSYVMMTDVEHSDSCYDNRVREWRQPRLEYLPRRAGCYDGYRVMLRVKRSVPSFLRVPLFLIPRCRNASKSDHRNRVPAEPRVVTRRVILYIIVYILYSRKATFRSKPDQGSPLT